MSAQAKRRNAIGYRPSAIGNYATLPTTPDPASPNTSSPAGVKERRALPNGWRWARMSEVCARVQDGTHFSPKEQASTGDFKYISAKNIKHWGLDLTELTYVPTHVHREIYSRCNPEKGDVLYIKDGVTTGIATVNTLDEEFSLLSSVALLKPRREVLDSHFLKYYLNSPEGFRNMTGQMTGTAIKRLILLKIKAALVPVAPLPEQRRIVAEIEKQFTRLEAGVAALRRVQANLKRYRAAVLKAACEGKLVPTEAELHRRLGTPNSELETGEALLRRILTERQKNWAGRGKYKEPAAPDAGNLAPLPEDWTCASLEQISLSSSYGTSAKCSYESSGPPVLRIPNISSGRIDLVDLKFAGASEIIARGEELRPGDLIIIRTNGSRSLLGRSAVVREKLDRPTDYASYLIRFRLFQEPVLLGWIGVIWDCPFLRTWIEERAATSAGQHNISMSVLATLPMPLPPIAEQSRIVAEVERRLSVVDELESVVSANLQRASSLRQSILQKAFAGQL